MAAEEFGVAGFEWVAVVSADYLSYLMLRLFVDDFVLHCEFSSFLLLKPEMVEIPKWGIRSFSYQKYSKSQELFQVHFALSKSTSNK